MLKQHRETKLLNNTSYNIVCTLLCIEHFLLPIKKQQPRVWKNDDIRRRFCLRQGELQLTILPEGPNTKSPWPDIERENQLTTTLQWSHLTTTTTQNHPQNILPMVQLTQRWKWRFFSQFLCVLSRCFLLLMIQKVSQSYPNARGVKKGLISTRGVSVEVIFDGKGASVWKKGWPMNKFKKWWWCLSTLFSPKCLASSTVQQLPDWKPPTQPTFIMQPKTVRREKQSSHHVDKKLATKRY